jgi:YfiH family protein
VGKPLLLHFADCVPVIIFDPVTRVLCIVHAGWKGTAGSIARNGVKLMERDFGARAANMVAAIGPAIGSCCYPTGFEVAERLRQTVSSYEGLFTERQGQVCPDLKSINAMQLLDSNVAEVDVSELCTACNPQSFYSHRASGGHTGRQGAIAALI